MTVALTDFFDELLKTRLSDAAGDWVRERCQKTAAGNLQDLYLGFGFVSRKIPKTALNPTETENRRLQELIAEVAIDHWSLADAVRVRLVLAASQLEQSLFTEMLDRLFAAGEVHELIALYQGLIFYPWPESHINRCGEGIRTNMGAVFKAVSQRNVYPSQYLPEGMWNQMILKCLFVEIALGQVIGLEQRNNRELSRMLCDYAHERWSAQRAVSPELWRCVNPDLYPPALSDLERVLKTGDQSEQRAAMLTLIDRDHREAGELVQAFTSIYSDIKQNQIGWSNLSFK